MLKRLAKSNVQIMLQWARIHWGQSVLLALTFVAFLYTFLSFAFPNYGAQGEGIYILMNINIILLLGLGILLGKNLLGLWLKKRAGSGEGVSLHRKLAVLFSLVAVVPAIIMAFFSVLFLNFGINAWFSDTVSTAVEESQAVAEAYLKEHKEVIRADVLAMANDLNRQAGFLLADKKFLTRAVALHASLRNFPEVLVFNDRGEILAQSGLAFIMASEPIPDAAYEAADRGDVVLLTSPDGSRVRALTRLDMFVNTYLYVSRVVDSEVIGHIEKTSAASGSFSELKENRLTLQVRFAIIFILVTLVLMILSVWRGLSVATALISPIGALIEGSKRMGQGDFLARVAETGGHNPEMNHLIRSFNQMGEKLYQSQKDLVKTNQELNEHNRFTEAVLSGVSAGIIGLDERGMIQYPNLKASEILGIDLNQHKGDLLLDLAPEFSRMMDEIKKTGSHAAFQQQIELKRHGRVKMLLVRLSLQLNAQGDTQGYVFTFDDITELLNAQRAGAWSEVARRLAHEIKNPLTPIHLAAGRLRKTYAPKIEEADREQFSQYTDIITRQVEDLQQLLDEFSSFARMPAPVLSESNLSSLVEEVVLLMKQSSPGISYIVSKPQQSVKFQFDHRQIRQALINILKNAAESIEEYRKNDPETSEYKITLTLNETANEVSLKITDTGRGLPAEDHAKLTEPYFTTRKNGTGLGLSVVSKIIEDHQATLRFRNVSPHGAEVSISFPKFAGDVSNSPDERSGVVNYPHDNEKAVEETIKAIHDEHTSNPPARQEVG